MKNKYKDLSKEELVGKIEKLESRKKYGLVWDEEKTKEKFEEDSENALPILKEIKKKEIRTDKEASVNILIEGDNYHSLSVLNFTHQGKIDVIYIDPPYNTGARDWKYNNDYVDINDTFRHSKWLSMMSKRLKLSRKLLSEEGVLICTIDHNELATLKLLLQEIFSGKEITCVTIVHNPSGIQGLNFSHNNEYALFVHKKNRKVIAPEERSIDDADVRPFINGAKGNTKNYLRESGYNCFYPIFIKNNKVIGFGGVCEKDFHPKSDNIRKNEIIEIYPIDNKEVERKWLFSRASVEAIKNELFVKYNKKGKKYKIFRTKNKINYKTVWVNNKFNAKTYGTLLLKEIIKTEFSFPKSLYAVEECIKAVVHDKDNSIILDFFAGSGTTGHAILDLNKKDGGKRLFIVCTNNENKICEEVTYPRIRNVILGYKNLRNGKKEKGLKGNLKYFKTSFVRNNIGRDEMKIKITEQCTEMLCLRESIFDEIKNTKSYKVFKQKDKIMAIYYSLERNKIDSLKKELDKISGDKILYCFTLDHLGLNENDFIGWDNVRLEPIPQKILDIYKNIYEY